ncbi:MAG: oxygen-independent coproporphyrinogen III oxidase [Pseudomonadota bacterium]
MEKSLASLCNQRVPRYTSYPTAPHFGNDVDGGVYGTWLSRLGASEALSLYLHVPFCRTLCHYCGCHTKVSNKADRIASYGDLLVREMETVARFLGGKRPLTHIHWGGGTPSLMPADAFMQIVQAIRTHFDATSMREHAMELDPREVTPQLAELLAAVGINRASLGVQEFSPLVQRAIGRLQPVGTVANAMKALNSAGITRINFDLMYGLPMQTTRDVRRTAALAVQLAPSRIALFGYAHVPWFARNQKLIDEKTLPNTEERFEQAEAAAAILEQSGYVRIGLDHYALPDDEIAVALGTGALARNFQGYTTDTAKSLIGLGSSSISRVPKGYAQNTPDMAAYRRIVEAGELPVTRGRAFSDDDLVRGAVIERLMCDMRVDLDGVAADFGVDRTALQPNSEPLTSLTENGLAEFDGHVLTMTERGRPFVRMAAASFDAYMANSGARHSQAV